LYLGTVYLGTVISAIFVLILGSGLVRAGLERYPCLSVSVSRTLGIQRRRDRDGWQQPRGQDTFHYVTIESLKQVFTGVALVS
jgi:hypothetical protein